MQPRQSHQRRRACSFDPPEGQDLEPRLVRVRVRVRVRGRVRGRGRGRVRGRVRFRIPSRACAA